MVLGSSGTWCCLYAIPKSLPDLATAIPAQKGAVVLMSGLRKQSAKTEPG